MTEWQKLRAIYRRIQQAQHGPAPIPQRQAYVLNNNTLVIPAAWGVSFTREMYGMRVIHSNLT